MDTLSLSLSHTHTHAHTHRPDGLDGIHIGPRKHLTLKLYQFFLSTKILNFSFDNKKKKKSKLTFIFFDIVYFFLLLSRTLYPHYANPLSLSLSPHVSAHYSDETTSLSSSCSLLYFFSLSSQHASPECYSISAPRLFRADLAALKCKSFARGVRDSYVIHIRACVCECQRVCKADHLLLNGDCVRCTYTQTRARTHSPVIYS